MPLFTLEIVKLWTKKDAYKAQYYETEQHYSHLKGHGPSQTAHEGKENINIGFEVVESKA